MQVDISPFMALQFKLWSYNNNQKIMRFISAFFIPAYFLLSYSATHAQSSERTADELARLEFSVHLLTYDTVSAFQTSLGEAYFHTMLHAFKSGLSPDIDLTSIVEKDKEKLMDYRARLDALLADPPTWDQLVRLEDNYRKYLDKSLTKRSKYNH